MRLTVKSFLLISLSVGSLANAAIPSHMHSQQEYNSALIQNQDAQIGESQAVARPIKPVTDTADFKYVLMSSTEEINDVALLRKTIAENLPEDVKLVILTSAYEADATRSKYAKWIESDRLIIAAHNDPYVENGFWARDSFPVPVVNVETGGTSLVSFKYFRTFRSADVLAQSVGADVYKFNKVFVGGNIMADENGDCFAIDSERLYGMTANDILTAFGCTTVELLPHLVGIGDVDEVVKILPNKTVLISESSYREQFEDKGYTVIQLPHPTGGEYRTYANSLIVGDIVFMPSYGTANDAVAVKIYEDLGYTVFPSRSNTLSDSYWGSIHCQTMAYPEIDLETLLRHVGAHVVEF